jgi:hypothetical protein
MLLNNPWIMLGAASLAAYFAENSAKDDNVRAPTPAPSPRLRQRAFASRGGVLTVGAGRGAAHRDPGGLGAPERHGERRGRGGHRRVQGGGARGAAPRTARGATLAGGRAAR